MDTLKQRAVLGAFWYGGSRFAIQGLTWAVTIQVARILSPDDYGLMGFAVLVAGLADMIADLGIGAAIIQRQDLNEDDLNAVFWFSLALNVVIYLSVWAASPLLAVFFKQPTLVILLRVLMLGFIVNSLRVIPWSLMTKRVEFKQRSIVEVLANIIGAFTTLGMAYAGFGVWSMVIGVLARQASLTIGCQMLQPWWPRKRFTWGRLRKVLGFGLNVSAGRVAWYAYSNADFLIVGRMLGQQSLGLYTMVWQLAMLPVDRVSSVVNQVAYPVYVELQCDPKRFSRCFLGVVKTVSLVTFPVLMGLCLVSDIAVPLVLTKRWADIVVPLRMMTLVGVVSSISVLIGPAMLARAKADLMFKYNMTCLVIMPCGLVIGAQHGIEGVCWAWLVLHPCLVVSWLVVTRKFIGYDWKELSEALRPATLCTLCMMAVLVGLRSLVRGYCGDLATIIVVVLVGGIGYSLCLWLAFRAQWFHIRSLFGNEIRI